MQYSSGSITNNSSMGLKSDKSSMYINIDTLRREWLPDRPRMHKVSPYLQMKKNEEPSVYEPISVSLGPYHHGKEEFSRAEEFKKLCLHWCANQNDAHKDYLYDLVFQKVDAIRDCYADLSVLNKYDDNDLTLMMLLDACFILNFMRTRVSNETAKNSYNCLGVAAALPFAARDIMVLENQIPFFVLKLLIPQLPQEWKATESSLLAGFFTAVLSVTMSKEYVVIPREFEAPPLHLLEVCWRVLVEKHSITKHNDEEQIKVSSSRSWLLYSAIKKKIANYASKDDSSKVYTSDYITCSPSAAYLKSKGIHFKLSSSHSLKDVKFTSYAFNGILELPACYVSNMAYVYLANMIAYEIAPNNGDNSPDLTMLSYACFLKLLIQTPADVIALRDQGILRLNRSANHEQVLELFRSIETFHLRDKHMYQHVMHRVGTHCNNKAKTWMADLIHGNLRNPWTITALFSASLLLILTLLQTFYTVRQAYP